MKKIPLTKGAEALVDDDLYEWLSQWKWHLSSTGYAVRRPFVDGVSKTIRMHRLIMDAPEDKVVDHINHNELDNRRSNLRICTIRDNNLNRRNPGKGYWFHRQNQNWVAELNGKHIGSYRTEDEAKAVVAAVRSGLPYKQGLRYWQIRDDKDTRCKNGHTLAEVGTYKVRGVDSTLCKKCQSDRSREYYRRKQLVGQ